MIKVCQVDDLRMELFQLSSKNVELRKGDFLESSIRHSENV